MSQVQPHGAPDDGDALRIHRAIEECRAFLARYRADRPRPPHDPDELQARIMRRGGRPGVEQYERVFRIEGMPAAQARQQARQMVEADRELLARHPQ